jgi:hypothetical protein
LVKKAEVKRPLGIPRCKWEDSIRIDLRKMGWEIVDWNHLGQDRDQLQPLVNTLMNIQVP